MTHSALQIADWLLAWADECGASVSNLKLQKLLYYAQGHMLGQTGQPLFNDEIQAWAHGPVVPHVYRKFKRYGADDINVSKALKSGFDWNDYRDVENHLVRVWNTYGKYEAWALRNMTHREAPWKDTFDASTRESVISKDSMRRHFTA